MNAWTIPCACLLPLWPATAAPTFELRLKSGECLIGEVISADTGSLTFASPRLGRVQIEQSQIASLQPQAEASRTLPRAVVATPTAPSDSSGGPLVTIGQPSLTAAPSKPLVATNPPSGGTAGASPTSAGTPMVGEALREEDIRQVFLRDSTILLAPGQWEAEGAISYQREDVQSLHTLFRGNLQRLQRRLTQMQVSLRYSPAQRWEIFGTLPFVYADQEIVRLDGQSVHRSHVGLGDLSLGLKWQALRESEHTPDLIVSVTGIAPTGRSPYRTEPGDFGWGNGHWGVGVGVQLVRTYDPVVVFGGVGYTYYFPTHAYGGTIEPGGEITYNLGFGFALNDRLSFSTQFAGTVQTGGESDIKVHLASRESLVLRLAMTARLSPTSYLEPSIAWGLSDESPDYQLSLSYAQRF